MKKVGCVLCLALVFLVAALLLVKLRQDWMQAGEQYQLVPATYRVSNHDSNTMGPDLPGLFRIERRTGKAWLLKVEVSGGTVHRSFLPIQVYEDEAQVPAELRR